MVMWRASARRYACAPLQVDDRPPAWRRSIGWREVSPRRAGRFPGRWMSGGRAVPVQRWTANITLHSPWQPFQPAGCGHSFSRRPPRRGGIDRDRKGLGPLAGGRRAPAAPARGRLPAPLELDKDRVPDGNRGRADELMADLRLVAVHEAAHATISGASWASGSGGGFDRREWRGLRDGLGTTARFPRGARRQPWGEDGRP